MRRRHAAAITALALALAACGGDDEPDAAQTDTPTADAPADAADVGGDDASSDDEQPDEASDEASPADELGFGAVVTGTVDVSGVDGSPFTQAGEEFSLIAAGGCQGDAFGMQVQVLDATPATIVQVLAEVDADLSGGATGTFDVEDLDVNLLDFTADVFQTTFDGPGTLEVREHEAPAELNGRRMLITLEGTGLEGPDGDVLDMTAEVEWIMGCP